jgi:molybdenum cofactor guanylyltransferase
VGLEHCKTPYMVTVPCDSPLFPADLVKRLGLALETDNADIALVATRETHDPQARLQVQPVFCLTKTSLIDSLQRFLQSGQRKIDKWTAQHRRVEVAFDDARAFVNANTPDELQALQSMTETWHG